MKAKILVAIALVILALGIWLFKCHESNAFHGKQTGRHEVTEESLAANSSAPEKRPSTHASAEESAAKQTALPNQPSVIVANQQQAQKQKEHEAPPAILTAKDTGYDGNVVIALDEAMLRLPEGRDVLTRIDPPATLETLEARIKEIAKGRNVIPVCYPERKRKSPLHRAVITNEILIRLKERGGKPVLPDGIKLYSAPTYAPDYLVLRAQDPFSAISSLERLRVIDGVKAATIALATRLEPQSLPNDEFFGDQWHLKSQGQAGVVGVNDINAVDAWQFPGTGGVRGRGIRIGIVDNGMQTDHPDLNVDQDVSGWDWNGNDPDPNAVPDDDPNPNPDSNYATPPHAYNNHGTHCAGNAAARGNNGIGVTGSAPEATLVGMRLVAALATDSQIAEAFAYQPNAIQVKSNSWRQIWMEHQPLSSAALDEMTRNGRSGEHGARGTIFLFSAGNQRHLQSDVDDGYSSNANNLYNVNSIHSICVGATDSKGRFAYYSNPGACVAVCAPSGVNTGWPQGDTTAANVVTTDRTGNVGDNTDGVSNDLTNRDYTKMFTGTSSSCPTVAGIVALMLEKRPDLGWRDVKEILIKTAREVNTSDTDEDWALNEAGYHFHHQFGAGLVDATAAVNEAAIWAILPDATSVLMPARDLPVVIPNNSASGVSRTFDFKGSNLRVEHVTLDLTATHPRRGDLTVTLTSPSGMVSRLAEVHNDDTPNYSWTFSSVRHWGESSENKSNGGTWTVTIADPGGAPGDGEWTGATLTLHGTSVTDGVLVTGDHLTSSGPYGGPFTPNSTTYTISNNGRTRIRWTADCDELWMHLSDVSGELEPGSIITLTASIDSNANILSVGTYTDKITITGPGDPVELPVSLTVTPSGSSVTNLSNITLSSGTLSPAFDPAVANYTARVSDATTTLTVAPTATEVNDTITVNGNNVISGHSSGSIPLAPGSNAITIVVKDSDGVTTKTYNLTIIRSSISGPTLEGLAANAGALNPTFDPDLTDYSINLSGGTNSITINPLATDSTSTIKVNGVIVPSGGSSGAIPITAGTNRIKIEVIGLDGAVTNYTITCGVLAEGQYFWTNFVGKPGGIGNADGPGSDARFYSPTSVAVDSAGSLYVADSSNHTIRKVTAAGVATVLAGSPGQSGSTNATGSAARFYYPAGVAVDGSGNVYVADRGNQTIRKVTAAGVVTTLAGSPPLSGSTDGTGSAARFWNPTGVAVDSVGNVYVADRDNATIRKVTAGGVVTTLAGSAGQFGSTNGTGSSARFSSPWGIAADGTGTLFVADRDNCTIRKVTAAGTVTTLAGGASQFGSTDGSGSTARFYYPTGVAVDSSGNVYVSDQNNDTIRKVASDGWVTTLAGTAGDKGSKDGTGTMARFYSPTGIAVDLSGRVYVADAGNCTIRMMTSGTVVTTLAGTAPDAGIVDATAGHARLRSPNGIALDGNGNSYVADTSNQTIRKISPSGIVTTLAGSPGLSGSADGTGNAARFWHPTGVTVDGSDNVYVADKGNHTIRKVTAAGVVTTLAGSAGQSGNADGTGSIARFFAPTSVAVDGAGNVFVAEQLGNRIRKITPGGEVTTYAGASQNGSTDGIGTAARFNAIAGVAVDNGGTVYVAEEWGCTIRRITPDRSVTTLAGSSTQSGSVDGTGGSARFGGPQGVAVDNNGNVFVADGDNFTRFIAAGGNYERSSHTIRKITAGGVVTTIGGTHFVASGVDGVGADSRFSYPKGIAVDDSGNIYVADQGNNRVVRGSAYQGLDTTPPTITITAPASGATLYTPTVTASGTASDDRGLVKVQIRLDGGSWIDTSGTANWSAAIPIAFGSHTLEARSMDSTGRYSTIVSRAFTRGTSSVCTLSSLTLSAGTFNPAFTTFTADYAVSVPTATSSVTVTPTVTNAYATIKVNGVSVDSGVASGPIPLAVGASTTVTILVTALDGVSTKTYAITIRRPGALEASFVSEFTIPGSFPAYDATGNTVNFSLSFAPRPGTSLTVLNNTGIGFIAGRFANLAQGQEVALTYGGNTYQFIANYYGGTGNDLVLQWANSGIFSWGRNVEGQLGNASTTNSGVPYKITSSGVLAGKTIVSMAVGGSHSLALCSDGTLAAWGNNIKSQLGNNSTINSNVPIDITSSGVLAGKTVVAVSAGADHSLALCLDGTLATWGYNPFSLGNGLATSALPVAITTSGVLAGRTVVAISSGTYHNLALCSDGTVAAWGWNEFGQLGNNTTNIGGIPVAVNAAGVLNGRLVVAISAGGAHSLALCLDGTLAAWGYNGEGQLGNNSSTNSLVPYEVTSAGKLYIYSAGTLFGRTVAAISAGGSHTLALCSDGTLAAWGYNNSGQVGNNSITKSLVPLDITSSGALSDKTVAAISAGSSHSLALCSDGTLTAWGLNGYGQLGINSTTNAGVPAAVTTFSDGIGSFAAGRFTALAVGSSGNHALAGEVGIAGNHSLSGLDLSAGTLSPTFASGTTSYTASVPNTTTTVTVTPTATEATATITVNGVPVASGSASGPIPLSVGTTPINIVVTAQSGSTTIYTVTVVVVSPPSVATNAANTINDSSATLNGTVNPNGSATTARFEYGLTTAYGSIASVTLSPNNGSSSINISAIVTALQPGQVYHYRLSATSMSGTIFGSDQSFITVLPFTYASYGTSITITGYTGTGGAVTIPNTINGLPVTHVGKGAFEYKYTITGITIPSSVVSIGDNAFSNCSGIRSILLPPNTVSIGSSAFYGCTGITSVSIPASVSSIGSGVFSGCTAFTTISVDPSNATYSSVEGVLLNKNKTTLISCPRAKSGSYTIPTGVTSLENSAFSGCRNLTSVVIPSGVTAIGFNVFRDCRGLTSITIPTAVTSIGVGAFTNCIKLQSISIPLAVTSIGSSAFVGCSGLTSVTISSGVTSIGSSSFSDCQALTSITVDPANPIYCDINGVLFNKLTTDLVLCPGGKSGTYTIPDTVTTIREYAFYGCRRLTGVIIPSSVTSILDHAFIRCSGLLSIELPSGLTEIKQGTFSGCSGLVNVAIPDSVTSIGIFAFTECTGLVNVAIPASVTNIGGSAFSWCSGLTKLVFYGNAPTMGSGVFDLAGTGLGIYYYSGNTGFTSPTWQDRPTFVVPSLPPLATTGNAFGISAFSATVDGTVNPNGFSATARFEYGLTTEYGNTAPVNLPPNNGFTALNISGDLIGLQAKTTYHYRLVTTNINGTIAGVDKTFITPDTYTYTTDSGNITITMYNGSDGDVIIPESINGLPVTAIADYAFAWTFTTLFRVTIPNSVTTIGDCAFYGNGSLNSITIPNSVTHIGDGAFFGCALASINIPGSVTSIGSYAFYQCTSLSTVFFNGDEPSIGSDFFYGTAPDFKIYYLIGARGFATPMWVGYPTQGVSDGSIITQPASTTIPSGSTTTLSIAALGTTAFTYQWYQGTSGTTTMPVGTNSASFTTPVLSSTTSYWVKVTNAANPTGANSNTATVSVNHMEEYSSWISGVFLGITDSSIISPTADPDHDGLSNAIELVVGGKPDGTSSDQTRVPVGGRVHLDPDGAGPAATGDYFRFTHRRTQASVNAGVTATCELAASLAGNWTDATLAPDVIKTVTPGESGQDAYDIVDYFIPIQSGDQTGFVRLKAVVP